MEALVAVAVVVVREREMPPEREFLGRALMEGLALQPQPMVAVVVVGQAR